MVKCLFWAIITKQYSTSGIPGSNIDNPNKDPQASSYLQSHFDNKYLTWWYFLAPPPVDIHRDLAPKVGHTTCLCWRRHLESNPIGPKCSTRGGDIQTELGTVNRGGNVLRKNLGDGGKVGKILETCEKYHRQGTKEVWQEKRGLLQRTNHGQSQEMFRIWLWRNFQLQFKKQHKPNAYTLCTIAPKRDCHIRVLQSPNYRHYDQLVYQHSLLRDMPYSSTTTNLQ